MQRKSVRCAKPIGKESYTVNFRHPVVKDKSGKTGLKIHRGLGTRDYEEAERLADMLEELISNDRWHNVSLRKDALKEGFPEVVVSAFYDPMKGRVIDNEIVLKKIAVSKEEEKYSRVLMLSSNGINGTSLLQWVYNEYGKAEETEKIPCNLDLVMSEDKGYEMVVSLMVWSHLDMYIQENIEAAIEYCFDRIDKGLEINEAELCNKLLVHESGAVNLTYIMGDITLKDKKADQGAMDDPERNIADMVKLISEFLDAAEKIARSLWDSHISLEDAADYPEYNNEIVHLRKYMVEEVKKKANSFKFLNRGEKLKSEGGKGWYYKTRRKKDYFDILRRFTDCSEDAWGTLLTPLVEEIRIKGKFPISSAIDAAAGDVSADGARTGELSAEDAASKRYVFFDRRIKTDKIISGMPLDLLEDVLKADIILLVDDGDQAGVISENIKLLLKRLIECGKAGRIITVFSGIGVDEGRQRLKDCLDEWESLTAYALTDTEKKNICGNCISLPDGAGTENAKTSSESIRQLIRKMDEYNRAMKPEVRLLSDELTLFQHLKFAIEDFRNDWAGKLDTRTSKLGSEFIVDDAPATSRPVPPVSLKKLTNRMAYYGMDQYNYELMPVADFIQTLSAELNIFINRLEVVPDSVKKDVAEEETITARRNEIKCKLNEKIAKFIKVYMWNSGNDQPPIDLWESAYKCSGKYAVYNRAEKINEILELGAPRLGGSVSKMTEIQWDYVMALFNEIETVLNEYGCVFERYIFVDDN